MAPIPDTARLAKNLKLDRSGTHGDLNTTIVVKEGSDKMIPNDILLLHQSPSEKFPPFLQQMGTKTKTHSQTVCKE